MTSRPARALAGARQVALWLAAIAGVLCILVTVASFAFGLRPLVFRSGSMAPTIDTGALAIAHRVDADDLRRADVVSVPTSGGERVTHRIVSVEHLDDQAVLRLRGDANDAADGSPYVVRSADVVLFSVPKVGTAVSWVTSPVGLVALGLYAGYLISVIVRRPAGRPPPSGGGRPRGRSPGSRLGGSRPRAAGRPATGRRPPPAERRRPAPGGTSGGRAPTRGGHPRVGGADRGPDRTDPGGLDRRSGGLGNDVGDVLRARTGRGRLRRMGVRQ